jgi:hypothetical protein
MARRSHHSLFKATRVSQNGTRSDSAQGSLTASTIRNSGSAGRRVVSAGAGADVPRDGPSQTGSAAAYRDACGGSGTLVPGFRLRSHSSTAFRSNRQCLPTLKAGITWHSTQKHTVLVEIPSHCETSRVLSIGPGPGKADITSGAVRVTVFIVCGSI